MLVFRVRTTELSGDLIAQHYQVWKYYESTSKTRAQSILEPQNAQAHAAAGLLSTLQHAFWFPQNPVLTGCHQVLKPAADAVLCRGGLHPMHHNRVILSYDK